jgi:hypothetical protein
MVEVCKTYFRVSRLYWNLRMRVVPRSMGYSTALRDSICLSYDTRSSTPASWPCLEATQELVPRIVNDVSQ